MDVLFWAIAFVTFVVIEICTIQLVSIWFAAGALVTLLITYFVQMHILTQLGIFIVATGIFLTVTFPYMSRLRHKPHVSTNSELDVGKTAEVIEEINTDKGTGRARLNGVDWCAVPENPDDVIPEGSIVTVVNVRGTKLTVVLKSEPIHV